MTNINANYVAVPQLRQTNPAHQQSMNATLLKDERTELEAFCETIAEAHDPSISREEEIIRNKREANHRKWEAKLRRASGCDGI